MIKEYVKKRIVVKAVLFDGSKKSFQECIEFIGKDCGDINDTSNIPIKTLEGVMNTSIGDYIIKGVTGEFYPCKPDVFKLTYDEQ